MKNKVEIIAEAGINHNGKFNNAIKLIRIAKIAKVNYVKFQLFTTENFINKKFNHHKLNYNKIYKRFKNLEFSVSEWKKIIKFGKQRGIKVFFSIFDISSLKILRKLNVKLVKIPSGEINNYPLLEKINKLRLRVILSTGMSSLKEIDKAVKKLKKCNLSLLHCVSEYPTIYPNLMAIQNLRKKFTGTPEKVVNLLKSLSPGEMKEPINVGSWWLIIRLECLLEATLDREMQATLSRELFDKWVNEEVEGIIKKLKTKFHTKDEYEIIEEK